MNPEDTKPVPFMGKITAGYTHEIRNILSIMAESVGLMQDILSMDQDRMLQYKDKLSSSLAMIEKQIERGDALSTHLNRLAHAPDQDVGQIDLDQATGTMVALTQRFARRHHLQLRHIPAGKKIRIQTRPFALMMLIHGLIQCTVQAAPQDACLDIQTMFVQDKARLSIQCCNHLDPADFRTSITHEAWESLQALCSPVQAQAVLLTEEAGIEILFP